jgi:hypothetical protein
MGVEWESILGATNTLDRYPKVCPKARHSKPREAPAGKLHAGGRHEPVPVQILTEHSPNRECRPDQLKQNTGLPEIPRLIAMGDALTDNPLRAAFSPEGRAAVQINETTPRS